ncbi:hypothetical protein SCP_0202940 [Sparassis crispa]|uniref:Zinc-ribbon 15 domain-containing protein n=1 Tax=Sparassis crispa TaxID=139825 RepID=A0A401GAC2_9APHY|nr:hypothetical protein SCP_0202940 [Sparassis crispa]GBE79097.1 hypothetical protein SCP_0202940 [Sparassis crispa]
MFLCLPIFFGCPTRIKPEGNQTPRICPRCGNASVHSAKSRLWFELYFIPLIPLSSKRIWICSICQWSIPMEAGWEPGYDFQRGGVSNWQVPPPSGYINPPPNPYQQGYQPGYIDYAVNQGQKPEGS